MVAVSEQAATCSTSLRRLADVRLWMGSLSELSLRTRASGRGDPRLRGHGRLRERGDGRATWATLTSAYSAVSRRTER